MRTPVRRLEIEACSCRFQRTITRTGCLQQLTEKKTVVGFTSVDLHRTFGSFDGASRITDPHSGYPRIRARVPVLY